MSRPAPRGSSGCPPRRDPGVVQPSGGPRRLSRVMNASPVPVSVDSRRRVTLTAVPTSERGAPVPAPDRDEQLLAVLAAVAPGTDLRDGLERILRGNTGGLIVLGQNKVVDTLCTGGFVLDVDFSATRLRELAKMD